MISARSVTTPIGNAGTAAGSSTIKRHLLSVRPVRRAATLKTLPATPLNAGDQGTLTLDYKSNNKEITMTNLCSKECEVCRIGAPEVSELELQDYKKQVPEWNLLDDGGSKRLQRSFSFKNFLEAMAFANKVGELAESEGHHPALLVEWGKVQVTWWTHKIDGLHENDFIMAAKTDAL